MAGYGLGGAALTSMIHKLSLGTALAQGNGGGYKALVCVFMAGGNDSNNTVIPYSNDPSFGYNVYSAARQSAGLAISQATLANTQINPPRIPGMTFAFHQNTRTRPSGNTSALYDVWGQGKLAVCCNTGTLVQPLTRAQYLAGGPRPYQLFSHSDQQDQWQSASSIVRGQAGWGGRTADRLLTDPPPTFPTLTTIAGTTLFTIGVNTRPLAIQPAPAALNAILNLEGFGNIATEPERSRRMALDAFRGYADDRANSQLVGASMDVAQQAIDIGTALSSDQTLATPFPNTNLGNQLKQVAKVMKANQLIFGLQRQVFFCSLGGFDTHQTQITNQGNLITQLSQAMGAFYDATGELGLQNNVTTFTLSDFSRTFAPAGSGGNVGSDHAWGSHQLIMGGSVNGGDFYGGPTSNGTVFPTLLRNTGEDADNGSGARGRWIPTCSVEQYGATMLSWFGLTDPQIDLVFPRLNLFGTRNLGFV
jgi:uncharacterized protein (DUF1501 family)